MEIRLAERVKELRKDVGISQAKLAEIISVDKAFIGHIENGKSRVSVETLILLAKHFDVSADYLLGLKDTYH